MLLPHSKTFLDQLLLSLAESRNKKSKHPQLISKVYLLVTLKKRNIQGLYLQESVTKNRVKRIQKFFFV